MRCAYNLACRADAGVPRARGTSGPKGGALLDDIRQAIAQMHVPARIGWRAADFF